ncbi:calcitonin-1-like isoform X3 [Pygocentrus nattereri]|uniref:Calcitonin peptide-like domain-containing protein n=1 Tax=Pygocentrus nattereri TaxID=42514 RepID=A0AAR2KMD7_PYGNA|nr:calcitonin-1-like isoform X3 [Pygocentrus nattereri]
MFMVKVSALFAAYFLLISLMYSSHAAPRSAGDSATDTVVLSDYEARRLINAIVKEFVQMTAEEVEQNDGNSPGRTLTKRCSSLSTCVLGKLSQELHKLQTFPRTDVGAGTPGKKRSLSGIERHASYGDAFDAI